MFSTFQAMDAESQHLLDVMEALEKDPWSVKLPLNDTAATCLRPAELWKQKCNEDELADKWKVKQQRTEELRTIMSYEVHARKHFRDNQGMPTRTCVQRAQLKKKLKKDQLTMDKLMKHIQNTQKKHNRQNIKARNMKQKGQIKFLQNKIKEAKVRHMQEVQQMEMSLKKEVEFYQQQKKYMKEQLDATKRLLKPKKHLLLKPKKHLLKPQKHQKHQGQHDACSLLIVPGKDDIMLQEKVPLCTPFSFRPPDDADDVAQFVYLEQN